MRAALLLVVTVACDPVADTAQDGDTAAESDTAAAAECREIADGRVICFPVGHVCEDPHGIGDGVPVVVDCWGGSGRACHTGLPSWPACAGGWVEGER